MDIQVGDKITYKMFGETYIQLISDTDDINHIQTDIKANDLKILKIERPKYEVVEEKKELLTKEEKEFLKDMCKYYLVQKLVFCDRGIDIWDYNERIVNLPDYPEDLTFSNIEKDKEYTLKELGLEEK